MGAALGKIGPAAVPALTEALRDRDGIVRGGAAEALGEIGPAAAEAVPLSPRPSVTTNMCAGTPLMARYPVTITQFQAFLKDCYQEGTWRLPVECPVTLPADCPPPKPRARYGNHPVDSVSWWDAAAFCYWLTDRLRRFGVRLPTEADRLGFFVVQLPTEAEWQLAATGGVPARTYPWGCTWKPTAEPWRANTVESELGRTTAAGMYPPGASAGGITDMAGTLWEWCRNAFDELDNSLIPASLGDRRVLRGGSWNYRQDYARAANRGWRDPYVRSSGIGFRVVCLSPSSDPES
ncbi:MAG: SUMF1/EgtB/PvdO family nonheme iron enzyme [Nitrospira sp.]